MKKKITKMTTGKKWKKKIKKKKIKKKKRKKKEEQRNNSNSSNTSLSARMRFEQRLSNRVHCICRTSADYFCSGSWCLRLRKAKEKRGRGESRKMERYQHFGVSTAAKLKASKKKTKKSLESTINAIIK
ncbi:hypothetical protein RFI_38747 [Reticulomyxa filosa]|uniref:Uncharacterized protein n=1 Tax=Reticulomyxa filosa TaxID=46433 RepID=X6LBH8_RETFI|nr:hypothetical protein RFI_38747 [Reticulomyxa filosa]|eukprot:ETN98740.1 hypothetical protein RFI_38747 [Reticulomyxa filosa]